MSIIIKGLNMPEGCYDCEGELLDKRCPYVDEYYFHKKDRHPNCPLIEIPEGHGRLIDANRLIRELSVIADRPIRSGMYIIREAPTILEAEGE